MRRRASLWRCYFEACATFLRCTQIEELYTCTSMRWDFGSLVLHARGTRNYAERRKGEIFKAEGGGMWVTVWRDKLVADSIDLLRMLGRRERRERPIDSSRLF